MTQRFEQIYVEHREAVRAYVSPCRSRTTYGRSRATTSKRWPKQLSPSLRTSPTAQRPSTNAPGA